MRIFGRMSQESLQFPEPASASGGRRGTRLAARTGPGASGGADAGTETRPTKVPYINERKKYDLIIAASGQVVYDYDMASGEIIWSGSLEQVLGYERGEMGGIEEWEERIHPEDRPEAVRLLEAAEKERGVYDCDYRFRHKNGAYRWIHDRGFFLIEDDRNVRRMFGMMQDIHERKQGELLQSAVYRIAQAADKSGSLGDLFRSVHAIISTVMPAGNFYIALYDDRERMLSFPYFVDLEDTTPVPKKLGKGLTEYVIRTGRPLLCDEATDRKLRESRDVELIGAPSAIWLGVPLIVDGTTTGAMVVQHYEDPNAYGPAELRMFEFVSSQVARSIERKRAEEALRRNEQRLSLHVQQTPLAVIEWDTAFRVIHWNEAAERIFGYAAEEARGRHAAFIVPERYKAHVDGVWEALLGRRGGQRSTNENVTKDGRTIFCEWYNTSLIDDSGRVIGVTSLAQDVTERMRAEEALRASEERFKNLFEKSSEAQLLLDAEGKVVDCNAAFLSLFAIPSESEVLGHSPGDFAPPLQPDGASSRERGLELMRAVMEKGSARVEWRHRKHDPAQTPIDNELICTMISTASQRMVHVTIRDITARKAAEEALRDSEELHRRLVAAVPDMIIRTDMAGNIVFANDVAVRLTRNGSGDGLVGRNVFSFVAPEDLEKAVRGTKEMVGRKIGPQEIGLILGAGVRTQFEVDGAILRNPEGSPYGIVYLCRDITERKLAESNLREGLIKLRSTLKASIDSLASAIEMRDPYTAGHQERVTGLARAIALEMGLGPEQVEAIEIAGVIHDIGKLYVPAEILSKPTKLSDLEYSMIKVHAQVGYTILSKIDFPWPIADIVHQHHEAVNGSGYPLGLKGKDILIEARILNVADVVEAMSSHRPYRPALGIQSALDEIAQKRGILYDRDVVDACLRLFREKNFKFD
jgi:PAS domain S-box-containing protein/putative nucleotidyltransferase with HDIG domain